MDPIPGTPVPNAEPWYACGVATERQPRDPSYTRSGGRPLARLQADPPRQEPSPARGHDGLAIGRQLAVEGDDGGGEGRAGPDRQPPLLQKKLPPRGEGVAPPAPRSGHGSQDRRKTRIGDVSGASAVEKSTEDPSRHGGRLGREPRGVERALRPEKRREAAGRFGLQEVVVLEQPIEARGGAQRKLLAERRHERRDGDATDPGAERAVDRLVRRVVAPFDSARGEPGAKLFATERQERSNDAVSPPRPDSGDSAGSLASGELQQKGLEPVVGRVAGGDERAELRGHRSEETVAAAPPLGLERLPRAPGLGRDVEAAPPERDLQPPGDGAAGLLVPVGFRAAKAVVEVRDRDQLESDALGGEGEQLGEGGRVASAGNGGDDPVAGA